MEDIHAIPYLKEIVLILIVAGIIVPLFNRIKVSPVLGYLGIGFLIGPHGWGTMTDYEDVFSRYLTIRDPEEVAHLAEFGVVFLLFMIGLELSPRRLWNMRRMVFGLGSLQVLVCGAVLGLCAWYLGSDVSASVVLGTCLALSSTAIVMQLLMDKSLMTTPLGRTCFSILLFQDLAVVPLLILTGLLGPEAQGGVGTAILLAIAKAAGAIALILLIGRFLLRPLYRLAGAAIGAEPFMAVTFLIIIGTAAITGMAGLSMALGAFLAGLLLAETEYSHSIEVYIEPFKGLLLGLFFMTVGMGVDPGVIKHNLFWVLVSVLGLMSLKSLIIGLLARAFGQSAGRSVETGLLLSQSGEFAFVVIGMAIGLELIPLPMAQFMLVVTGISMALTPLVAAAAHKIGPWIDRKNHECASVDQLPEEGMKDHVIIAGFGRVGRGIAKILDDEGIPYIAIDINTDIVARQRQLNKPVVFGDVSRTDILKSFNPETARAIVMTISDARAAVHCIKAIRRDWPDIPIYSRAKHLKDARKISAAGTVSVITDTVEAGLQLAGMMLRGIGIASDAVSQRLEMEREYLGTLKPED